MNKIKPLRDKLGMTIRGLSDKSNVAIGYLSNLENDTDGKTNPTKDVMERISAALERTVPEVFY